MMTVLGDRTEGGVFPRWFRPGREKEMRACWRPPGLTANLRPTFLSGIAIGSVCPGKLRILQTLSENIAFTEFISYTQHYIMTVL